MGQTTSSNAINTPFVDLKTGLVTFVWLKIIQVWQQQLAKGFDSAGTLISNIASTVQIVGRSGTISSILQHLSAAGIIDSGGLPAATDITQGAVFVPPGASNVLGTAALQQVSAFDPAGAAAAAQTNANTFASAAANAAQSNAEAHSDAALSAAFVAGLNGTVPLAKITVGGADGSLTFTSGLITAFVAPT